MGYRYLKTNIQLVYYLKKKKKSVGRFKPNNNNIVHVQAGLYNWFMLNKSK